MRYKLYDEINALNPSDMIEGHNGEDRFGKVQDIQHTVVNRRRPPFRFSSVLLPHDALTVHPVESVVIDQYLNVYYLMSCALMDGELHTFCERVSSFKRKKNYELGDGWNEDVYRRLRDKALEAISDAQHELLKRN